MTPEQNAQTLINYWKSAAMPTAEYNAFVAAITKGQGITISYERAVALAKAQLAMKELVQQATSSPAIRISAFARNGIFEQSLLLEDGRMTSIILAAARAGLLDMIALSPLVQADRNLRPPRQIMLDAIYSAGTAGIFSIKDPSGLTSWLRSVSAAGIAIIGAVKGDPDGGTRAALLKLLRDLAMPVELARALKEGRTFEALVELLPASPLPVEARKTIQVLGSEADARVSRELAQLPDLGALPSFPTGDGALAPTLPPAIAWYRRPVYWFVASGGLIAGGLAVGGKRRTRPTR